MLRLTSGILLLVGVLTGTLRDSSRNPLPADRGGYKVIEADFHVHSHFGDGILSPFSLVLQAQRQGLHAIAITDHNQIFAAKCGRWFSKRIGGPTVLVGEEVTAPSFHLIAVGLTNRVKWQQSAAEAIQEIQRQGGIAIAAHPTRKFWEGFDKPAMQQLDGTEVMHTLSYASGNRGEEIRAFYRTAEANGRSLTAIGSSDYHWFDSLGMVRTYVFVRSNSESEILDALRNGRTVVYDREGTEYGKPELIALLKDHPVNRNVDDHNYRAMSITDRVGRACGWFGLLGLVVFGSRKQRRL